MASSKPQASSSAASPIELNEVQVLDSNEPLVTVSSSVLYCSVQVIDSSEPLVPTIVSQVQVLDSYEPLVLASSTTVSEVQVLDTNEPLVLASSITVSEVQELDSNEPLVSCETAGTNGMTSTGMAEMGETSDLAGPSRLATAGLIMPTLSEEILSGSSGRRVNYYSEEVRSMWNWRKIFQRLGTKEQCIQFAKERGLIPTEKNCARHHRPMILRKDVGQLGQFRCRKSNCRTRPISHAVGTWFENVHLAITFVFQIMYAFSEGLAYHQVQKQLAYENEPVLSTKTVADCYSYCRETIVVYELEHQETQTKIGGPNKIVQIDESKCGKRKYNRGQHIEGHWVLGIIENGNDDLRLEVCPDNERSAEILVPLIRKHVQEGSILHKDYWRAYLSLPEHGYIHRRVNHSDPTNRFVALDGTHTQRIESQWRGLKKAFRLEHNKMNFTDWLCEYSWRRKNGACDDRVYVSPFCSSSKGRNYL